MDTLGERGNLSPYSQEMDTPGERGKLNLNQSSPEMDTPGERGKLNLNQSSPEMDTLVKREIQCSPGMDIPMVREVGFVFFEPSNGAHDV